MSWYPEWAVVQGSYIYRGGVTAVGESKEG